MTNQNEANYLASKISQLKIVERSKKLEKSKKR